MNKKLTITLIIIGLMMLLGITTLLYMSLGNEDETPIDIIDEVGNETDSNEEINTDEISKDIDLNLILKSSRGFATIGRFDLALEALDAEIEKDQYLFSKNEIMDYYDDLLFLSQLVTQSDYGLFDDMLFSIRNMNYPENFIIGFLGLDFDLKTKLIFSSITLLPPPNPKIENFAISMVTEENDVTKDIFARDMEIEHIYDIEITLNGDKLAGTIVKNNEGYYVYELTGDTLNMITVEQWINIKGGN